MTEYATFNILSIDGRGTYEAFGEDGNSNGNNDQPFMFTGEHDDVDQTDLMYLRARYYDPVIGRFITRDPYAGDIYNPQTLNRYSYVENNPVNKTDPSGLASSNVLQSPLLCAEGIIESELQRQKQIFDNLGASRGFFPPAYVAGVASTFFQSIPEGKGVSEHVRKTLESSGITCIVFGDHVWDTSSYGNVVYGYQMKRLGIPLDVVLLIGDADQRMKPNGTPDPSDDIDQIKAGYMYDN